jgi:hypothetical protein
MDMSLTGELMLVTKADDGSLEACGIPLKKEPLSKLMKIASRIGVLYSLPMSQRMYLNLVIKLVDKVASMLLAKLLAPIILKLLRAMKGSSKLMIEVLGKVKYWMMTKGQEKAQEISQIAQKWGNKTAHKWAKEIRFIRYLTIMNMSSWENESRL